MLAAYQGMDLVPGMGAESSTVENDNGIIYGSALQCVFLTYAVIDGAARDAGNTGNATVLRPGLIMAQNSTTKKWLQFDNGGAGGQEIPMGILMRLGVNTQQDNSDQDRFLATIMVGGNINPEALCIAASAGYGLDKSTTAHLNVRKAFKYAFRMSDDFMAYAAETYASRIA